MIRARRPDDTKTYRLTSARRLALIAFALGLSSNVQAGGYLDNSEPATQEKPSWAVPAERMAVEGDDASALQAEVHNAQLRVVEAQQNEATAEWAYTRARTRNYPRGDALEELRTRYAELSKERADAEKSFLELVDRARQAGVAPGTLSPYMDLADEIQSNPAKDADPDSDSD
jgi:hypothetical protein